MGSEIVIDGMKFEELSSDFGDDEEFAHKFFKELDSGNPDYIIKMFMYMVNIAVGDAWIEVDTSEGRFEHSYYYLVEKKLLESTETGGKVKRLSRLFYLIRDKILSDAGLEEGLRND